MWGCGAATAPGGAARPLASSRAAQAVLARPAVSAPGTAEFVFVWEITAPRPPPLCPSPRRPTRRTRRAPGSADVAEAVAKAGTGPNASLRPTRPDGLPGPGRWHRAGGRVGTAERPCPALAVRPWPRPCFAARGGTAPRHERSAGKGSRTHSCSCRTGCGWQFPSLSASPVKPRCSREVLVYCTSVNSFGFWETQHGCPEHIPSSCWERSNAALCPHRSGR